MPAQNAEHFLEDYDGRSLPWPKPAGAPMAFETQRILFGNGDNALEVAIASATQPGQPKVEDLRALFKKRQANRPAPVLLVVTYTGSGDQPLAAVVGTIGDPAPVTGLGIDRVARICAAALAEPDRHAAARSAERLLAGLKDQLSPGLVNFGLFASHELRTGVPARPDWEPARAAALPLLGMNGLPLIHALGYQTAPQGSAALLLIHNGHSRAVAVLLDETEVFDRPSARFGAVSPIAHGLTVATREELPWLVVLRGTQIRLYPARSDIGVGRKGQAETYTELDLALLSEDEAAYLTLLFAPSALDPGGTAGQILAASENFAVGLGERLRERIYEDVVPGLALAVAARMRPQSDAGPHRGLPSDPAHSFPAAVPRLRRRPRAAAIRPQPPVRPARHQDAGPRLRRPTGPGLRHAGDQLVGRHGHRLGGCRRRQRRLGRARLQRRPVLPRPVQQPIRAPHSPASGSPTPSSVLCCARCSWTSGEDGTQGPVDFRSPVSARVRHHLRRAAGIGPVGQPDRPDRGRKRLYVPAGPGDEVVVPAGDVYIHNQSGQRKATGSYFTKQFAVEHLLDTALEPAIDAHLARVRALLGRGDEAGAAEAFFDFRVADLAMGSAHFLVAAIDRIEARFTAFLTENPIPAVSDELARLAQAARAALGEYAGNVEIETGALLRRQIARRCVYGIDINLMAVELARLAIWIHTFVPGLPLSSLDHNLVVGNSLTGIGTIDEVLGVLEPQRSPGQDSFFADEIRLRSKRQRSG